MNTILKLINPIHYEIGGKQAYFVVTIVKRLFSQISLILLILVVVSCHRPPEFPEEPRISFESLILTDTASMVLEFNVRDGDGDIGLQTQSDDPEDSFAPFHPISWIFDGNNNLVTISSEGHSGPYSAQPVARFNAFVDLIKFDETDTTQFIETVSDLRAYFSVGDPVFFSESDLRPGSSYECEDFEIVERLFVETDTIDIDIDGQIFRFFNDVLVSIQDTVFVERNPFHFNIYIELLIKDGDNYLPFEFEECDPGYTSRFPVFKKSAIGRPLDGKIEYAFFSTQFDAETSFLINETLRLRFYIYDRALNQSNVVTTSDFTILGLRAAPLLSESD